MYAYMYRQKQNRIELVSPYGKWLQWLKKEKQNTVLYSFQMETKANH